MDLNADAIMSSVWC